MGFIDIFKSVADILSPDKKLKEDADTLNSADSLMFQIGKSLEDLGDKISDEERSEINLKVDKLRESCNKKEISEVQSLTEEVNKKFQEISQKLYEQTKPNEDDTEDNIQNVEFEEVK